MNYVVPKSQKSKHVIIYAILLAMLLINKVFVILNFVIKSWGVCSAPEAAFFQ